MLQIFLGPSPVGLTRHIEPVAREAFFAGFIPETLHQAQRGLLVLVSHQPVDEFTPRPRLPRGVFFEFAQVHISSHRPVRPPKPQVLTDCTVRS